MNYYSKGLKTMKKIYWEDVEWVLLGFAIPALTFFLSTLFCEKYLGSHGRYGNTF